MPPARGVARGGGQGEARAYRDWTYWGRPVPGFGPVDARLLVVGLAPAAHGGNRTGRMFTGDRSGDVLYAALHAVGLASEPTATHVGDGLEVFGVRLVAPVRCAPPANKPTPGERDTCRPFLERELALLGDARAVVVLGGWGWQALLPVLDAGGGAPAAARVRARRARDPRAARRPPAPASVRLLPREPAEHLHRPPDPRHARGGPVAGGRGGGPDAVGSPGTPL